MSTSRAPGGHGPAWLLQAAEIARRFHIDGESKVSISDELGLSRFKVARILDEAHELGLVQVRVELPAFIDADLSTAVSAHTGARTIVLSPDVAATDVGAELGRLGADLLTEQVTDADVLGLSCSRTVTASCAVMTRLAACEVVQLTGTLAGHGRDSGSVESVRAAAALGGGVAHPIYAPMVLPDAATARGLTGQDAISQVLDRVPHVTVAMVSIGGWAPGTSTVWEVATEAEREATLAQGAVGEIGGRLFDAEGSRVATDLDERVLGMTLQHLHDIDQVIGLAHGADRGPAVRAALLGGLVDTLVCDHELATTLLSLPPRPTGKEPS